MEMDGGGGGGGEPKPTLLFFNAIATPSRSSFNLKFGSEML